MKKLLTPLMAFALAIVFTACQTAPSSSVLSSPAPSEKFPAFLCCGGRRGRLLPTGRAQ